MAELDEIISLCWEEKHFLKEFQLRVEYAENGESKLISPIRKEICNNFGSPHGGFYMTLCDMAATLAAYTDGRRYVTQNCSIQFLGAPHSEQVIAKGSVLHRGKTVTGVRTEITDETGKLICEGLFSMFAVQKQFSSTK